MLTAKGLESHRKQLASIAPASACSVEVAQLAVVHSAASFFPSTREQLKKRVEKLRIRLSHYQVSVLESF